MDEILPPGENMSHPFDNYINSVLDESYRQVLRECPVSLLPLTEITGTVIYDSTNKLAYVPVPDDCIRLGLFKFSDWVNPGIKSISVDHPDYKFSRNSSVAGESLIP